MLLWGFARPRTYCGASPDINSCLGTLPLTGIYRGIPIVVVNLHLALAIAGVSLPVHRGMMDISHARLNYSRDGATDTAPGIAAFRLPSNLHLHRIRVTLAGDLCRRHGSVSSLR